MEAIRRTGCTLLAALAASWQSGAVTAGELPAALTGFWGTADSLYEGSAAQNHLHLMADGVGILVGSTPAPQRIHGSPGDGGPTPRAVIGFPVRATFADAVLTVQPLSLQPQDAEKARRAVFSCRYQADVPALECGMPNKRSLTLTRRADTSPADIAAQIEAMRAHLP